MDIKDLKKAGINNSEKIDIKELDIKEKNKEIKFEEIKIEKTLKKESQNKFSGFWKTISSITKKFWNLVWKDDSLKGWLVSIIFLFVVIKFIFFPLLSLATGTSLPLAIVESCSMYHDGNLFSNFDSWWERHDAKYSDFIINNLDFENFPFKSGMNKGDILFIIGVDPENIKVGDVIIFDAGRQNPLIHRVINIKLDSDTGERTFSTIGDNNYGQLPIEEEIKENQVIGKATFKIAPYLGWGKLIFFESKKSSAERGFCSEN